MSTADSIAAIVAGLRATHDDLALPDSCDVIRVTGTVADGRGGTTDVEETVATVRCALDVAGITGQEGVSGSVETVTLPYVITLPYGTDVTEADTIGVGARRFAVETVRTGGDYDVATEVTAREVG